MKRQTAVMGMILCVVPATQSQPSFSQTRRQSPTLPARIREWQRQDEQRRLQNERKREEFAKVREDYRDEVYQEALGADAKQWARIKAKIQRITELRVAPSLHFHVYSFTSSSSSRSGGSARYGYGSRGSAQTGFGSGSGSRPPGRSGRYGAGGSAGAGGYGYSATGTGGGHTAAGGQAGGTGGVGLSGGGAAAGPERPVKKRVGDMNLGWDWWRPSQNKAPEELTEGDRTCEQLLNAIIAENPDGNLVQEQIGQLRRIRRRNQEELDLHRRQLREIVTPEQEAKLILMGYLE